MNAVTWHTHEPEYGLMDLVSSIRMRPGLVWVSSGMVVTIEPFFYVKPTGALGYSPRQTWDLSANQPALGLNCWAFMAMVLATGEITVQTDTPTMLDPDDNALLDFSIDGLFPLMAFALTGEMTTVTYQHMHDVRLWAAPSPTDPLVIAAINDTLDDHETRITTLETGASVTRMVVFVIGGELGLGVGAVRIENRLGQDQIITGVYLRVGTAPVGANIVVDVNRNDSTIFVTQANRPVILDGEYSGVSGTVNVTAWPVGSYLSIDIDGIGDTTPGSDLVVEIVCHN
jgi:hypothetical protein